MTPLLWLTVGMAIVTYVSRATPLLVPGVDRLPPLALAHLRLVGPAVLAALVAANVLLESDVNGRTTFHVGIEWVAIAACVALVLWRRVLLLGLVVAVVIVAVARGLAG